MKRYKVHLSAENFEKQCTINMQAVRDVRNHGDSLYVVEMLGSEYDGVIGTIVGEYALTYRVKFPDNISNHAWKYRKEHVQVLPPLKDVPYEEI